MYKNYALITGATGGLGKAFARLLAERGDALIVTGRSKEKLADLKAELLARGGAKEILCLAADLSDAMSRAAAMQTLADAGVKIELLVNAAGADIQKAVSEYTQEKIAFQCRVNFEAAASWCAFAIKHRAEHLEIVNVSSVSGVYPMPYFAIYSATKSALTSFSMSLRMELKNKNAAVTAVLPGAMPTRQDIKEQIRGQGLWGKLAAKTPEFVAKAALKAVGKNKKKVIPGFWNKVMRITTAWLPLSWKMHFIAKRWSKITKDAF